MTNQHSSFKWTTINPTTGNPIAGYFYSSSEEIETGLTQLENEFHRFRRQTILDRTEGILRLRELLLKHKTTLASLMAQEMGKPIRQGFAEIEKCAATCEYYADMGEKFMMSQEVSAHYPNSWVLKKPLGIILAVMPWNFPFWQIIRCAVPAWLSGNVILLKHAPSVQGCARWIQDIVHEAFKATPLLQLPMTNHQTERVLSDPRVKALSFTGSSKVGAHLSSIASLHLKKSVLELGGSDPYIVLDDADVSAAAQMCVRARFINSGQSCVAAKRFLIHQSVYEEFKNKTIENVRKLRMGDPLEEVTDIGPLAEDRLRSVVVNQIEQSLQMGAQMAFGGLPSEALMNGKGFYFEPTIIENVNVEMPIMNDECFGPVMPLMPIASLEHGIMIANQSPYGLGAAIFTKSPELVWPVAADELNVGMVTINDTIQSDPRLPFGGVKNSGWGRELGPNGVLEFVNIKTIGLR